MHYGLAEQDRVFARLSLYSIAFRGGDKFVRLIVRDNDVTFGDPLLNRSRDNRAAPLDMDDATTNDGGPR